MTRRYPLSINSGLAATVAVTVFSASLPAATPSSGPSTPGE